MDYNILEEYIMIREIHVIKKVDIKNDVTNFVKARGTHTHTHTIGRNITK